ncbi:MAG: hypothetical protein VW397_01285 [Candidatus Margulisiibacteriota bacterium]
MSEFGNVGKVAGTGGGGITVRSTSSEKLIPTGESPDTVGDGTLVSSNPVGNPSGAGDPLALSTAQELSSLGKTDPTSANEAQSSH